MAKGVKLKVIKFIVNFVRTSKHNIRVYPRKSVAKQ